MGSLLLALSLPVVANRLAMTIEHYPPLDPARPVQADVIVVLGGGMRRPPAPASPVVPTTLESVTGRGRAT